MKKEEKERAKQINFLENEIVKLQAEVDRSPPVDLPNDEELKDQQRQVNLEKSALGSRIDEFNGKMSEIANKKAAAKSEYDVSEKRQAFFSINLETNHFFFFLDFVNWTTLIFRSSMLWSVGIKTPMMPLYGSGTIGICSGWKSLRRLSCELQSRIRNTRMLLRLASRFLK
jgi:hypothetical protein